MAYNDETQTEWCERTYRDVWDGEMVVRWEVETRANGFAKWAKHETIAREHVKTPAELEQAIERARSNAEPGSKVRVLAWVSSFTRRQVTTRTWSTVETDSSDGFGGSDDNLLRFTLGLLLQGRDVGMQTLVNMLEHQRRELERRDAEIDQLRNWKLETIGVVEDLKDRKAQREADASSQERRGRMIESVVNSGAAKLLGATEDDEGKKAQIRTLLGSALSDFGKSLTPEQKQKIADALGPEQQLAFYLAVLPEDGGHDRLEELQEAKQKALPSPELLTIAKERLPAEEYTQLVRLLGKAKAG